ncbi:hypothetical protein P43SY_006297 [Pythium insidiosum]|uniref:RING-type E3 ubiquitin transferase n=1 Tax=Pythium insidiosum TaxID=114742 RepID=A0AAD5QA96_PYTIN|nr:hypothetical protein P43SY_006297 [Pythium insidiosum]
MATDSLNASAAPFVPTNGAAAAATAASAPQTAGSSKPRNRRGRSAKRDGAAAAPSTDASASPSAQRKPKPKRGNGGGQSNPNTGRESGHNGEGAAAAAPALVPASVRRRRKPAKRDDTAPPQRNKQADIASPCCAKEASGEQEADDEEEDFCLLCADPIAFYAVGDCNHHGICSKCSLRMRMLMNDRNCPICKQHLDRVVVSRGRRQFDSFQLWGDAGGRDSVRDDASDIIFYECRAHYNTLRALRDYACRMKRCRVVCGSLSKLKDHLRIEHSTEFCELCMEHQHFFVQEHEVFTKAGLRAHNVGRNRSAGPRASGKDFHPMCQFCKRRFYGDMQLYEHLERDHFRCHICKSEHEYFRNYLSLEAHYRHQHHLCEDPVCLANRFIVFPNEIEYNAHMRAIHGVTNRIVLNFQVARGGENPISGSDDAGEEIVPDSWRYETQEAVAPRVTLDHAFPALPAPAGPPPPPVSQPAIARRSLHRSSSAQDRPDPSQPPRGQALRNQRFAEALGLARPGQVTAEAFEEELKTPSYPTHLIDWGKANLSYLQVVERRLERIVTDASCHSVSLRPMPSEERALMHLLASFYEVPSESFGEDPHRRVSFFKRETAAVPHVTLSTYIRNISRQLAAQRSSTLSRLSFLPLRGAAAPAPAPAAAAAVPAAPRQRGWEKIEPKRKPVVEDAWSDDDDDATNALVVPRHDDDEEA